MDRRVVESGGLGLLALVVAALVWAALSAPDPTSSLVVADPTPSSTSESAAATPSSTPSVASTSPRPSVSATATPSTTAAVRSASPTPRRTSARPRPPRQPTASPSPSARATYLPPGLRFTVTHVPARPKAGERVTLSVRVRDTDGVLASVDVEWGDGSGRSRQPGPAVRCAANPPPHQPEPTDRTVSFTHVYDGSLPGYDVLVYVVTGGQCRTSAPVERKDNTSAPHYVQMAA